MVAFNKYQDFSFQLGKGVHQLHAAGHTLKVMLSNTAPNLATHTVRADVTEISAANGYVSGGVDTQNDYTTAAGIGSCTGVDVTITASGGSFGPFRYVILYNDTPTSPADPLIGYWDYGSSISVNDTEFFTTDFGASMFTVT